MQTTPNEVVSVGLRLIANSVQQPAEKSMLQRWMKEYDTYSSRQKRRRRILDAIREGYDSYGEIAAATEIPEPTVRKIIQTLVQSGKVVMRRVKPPKRKFEYRFELAEGL